MSRLPTKAVHKEDKYGSEADVIDEAGSYGGDTINMFKSSCGRIQKV
ncbi:MAG TPA: hypothetical protein VIZ65_08445 [Cellvibrionaceae bacterium]